MVLSKSEINQRCRAIKPLIENMSDANVQACSYDLRMGNQYYYDDGDNNHQANVRTLGIGEYLKIPPNAICYVITEELVNIPGDLTASISLSFGLIKRGVMLAAQPPYDPGYSGKTVALLHNLSNETIVIKRKDHSLNIIFEELTDSVPCSSLYKGDYQSLTDLSAFCQEVRVGAVFALKKDLTRTRERFNNFMPNIVTVITIIIAVLTVLFSVFLGASTIQKETTSSKKTEYPEFSIDEETGVLTVCIDGKYYYIDIDSEGT